MQIEEENMQLGLAKASDPARFRQETGDDDGRGVLFITLISCDLDLSTW